MQVNETPVRIGYVLKRYPRYSETFIVNEILAHEAAGLEIEIFSLLPPDDGHFQNIIAQVRAPVQYLPHLGIKAMDFWQALEETSDVLPALWTTLNVARGEDHRDVYQALVLARTAHFNGIQHLHAHFATSATTVARLASHFSGIPYTFTAHAKDIYHQDMDPMDLKRKFHDAAAVITVSNYNLNYLHTTIGPDAAHTQHIYNGLDLTQFSYKKPDNRLHKIVSVGRLVEKKGLHDLIDACGIIAERDHQFRCSIIGTGPLECDLRAHIERLGLKDRVELIGSRPQREVKEYIQTAAVFAAPCIVGEDGNRDGLPTVLLEAMALGTPCVSTDVTGIPEVLRDGETGLMVPQHDPTNLANALEQLLKDSAKRVRLAAQARSLIEAEFDIHRNAARLRETFIAASGARLETQEEQPMRVAYVCADPGVPVFGCKGCSIHVQEILRALKKQGADITLFAIKISSEPPPGLEDISICKLPCPSKRDDGLRDEQAALKLNETLHKALEDAGPFDLVYERYSLWSFAAMEYARSMGIPGLLEVNAPLIEEQAQYRGLVDHQGAEQVAERVFSAANILIAVSRGVATYLARYTGVNGKVRIVPNGVNPDRFQVDIKPYRHTHPGTFIVGFVGTLKPWHGLPTLVEAFAHIHRQGNNIRLMIVGDGPGREDLVKHLTARNLTESVEFTGAVDPSEIPGLLSTMDVAVAPYPNLANFYFSPLKVYEYMAAGLPVVATRIGQLAELIQDGMNGFLVPPDDPDAMAAVLDKLRCEPDLRIRMGQMARTTILFQHTWDAAVSRIIDLSGLRTKHLPRYAKEI